VFSRDRITQGGQAIFRDGALENVTASPVNNITFGFGGAGVIGYIDRAGKFGQGALIRYPCGTAAPLPIWSPAL
jgi:hypothetical protein